MRTKKIGMIALLLCLCAAIAQAQAPPQVIGTDTLLRQESDISQLPQLTHWVSYLQSSYDRTGGNGDSGNYLSATGGVGTLADMNGPGAIVRIWSANPGSRLKIYIDDNPIPVIDTDFNKLFDGSLPPFEAPLAQTSSGGFYSYIPIPYTKHCRVTLDGAPGLYYQVNYVTFPPGTQVRPFALPLTTSEQAALAAAKAVWSDLTPPATLPGLTKMRSLLPQKTLPLGSYSGPGVIQQMRMALPDATAADLRRIVLRGYFDGHTVPDIQAPVSDFFGNAYGRKPFKTLLLTGAVDGSFAAKFPMPFGRIARFTLESGASHPLQVAWSADMAHTAFDPARSGYFHATWWQEKAKSGVEHTWARVTGQRGKFVGVVQTMAGLGNIGFLEGDEKFRVDDQPWGTSKVASSVIGPWNGTGTEDCFNSGWYFSSGPNSLPMNGVQVRDDSGLINCFRWFLLDAPTFQKSLDAQIETDGGTYYSSVAYWYSDGAVQPWTPFPALSALGLPRELLPLFTLPHPFEGEALAGKAKVTKGAVETQGMGAYGGYWSGGNQLFWKVNAPNATLTLTFTPPAAGTYDLVGYFTKAGDYGQVTFALNGKPVGGTFDGFARSVLPSGPVDLGTVTLPAEPSTFVVTATGKNALAGDYYFGLDALCLNAPGSQPTPLPVASNL